MVDEEEEEEEEEVEDREPVADYSWVHSVAEDVVCYQEETRAYCHEVEQCYREEEGEVEGGYHGKAARQCLGQQRDCLVVEEGCYEEHRWVVPVVVVVVAAVVEGVVVPAIECSSILAHVGIVPASDLSGHWLICPHQSAHYYRK